MFLRLVKERLRDNFGQTIQRELRDTSRGKNYVLYHEHFLSAKYLDIVKTQHHRIALVITDSLLKVEDGISHTLFLLLIENPSLVMSLKTSIILF